MTLDEFAETTRFIIANEGIGRFLPTACFPSRRQIKVLAGLPPEVDPDLAVIEWAAEQAEEANEEFLVAFPVGTRHFKVIRTVGPFSENKIFSIRSES